MQVHFGAELLHPEWDESVVCIGTFDGVHLGHQKVIATARDIARQKEMPLILVTFDRHPATILAPDKAPKPISSIAGNLRMFQSLGVAVAVILPFTVELSHTTADEFFKTLLKDTLAAGHIVVGHDFAFGFQRKGTPEWLQQRIETTVVPAFGLEGKRVSSSQIRNLISVGDFPNVKVLLGRNWGMPGIVVAGKKLGRTLGFPTINVARAFDQIMPPDGIYAGIAETDLGSFVAAISIGTRPSIGGTPRTIEAYLLDFPGDALYGTSVLLRFHLRIRDERNFDTLESLKVQMAIDVAQIREEMKNEL